MVNRIDPLNPLSNKTYLSPWSEKEEEELHKQAMQVPLAGDSQNKETEKEQVESDEEKSKKKAHVVQKKDQSSTLKLELLLHILTQNLYRHNSKSFLKKLKKFEEQSFRQKKKNKSISTEKMEENALMLQELQTLFSKKGYNLALRIMAYIDNMLWYNQSDAYFAKKKAEYAYAYIIECANKKIVKKSFILRKKDSRKIFKGVLLDPMYKAAEGFQVVQGRDSNSGNNILDPYLLKTLMNFHGKRGLLAVYMINQYMIQKYRSQSPVYVQPRLSCTLIEFLKNRGKHSSFQEKCLIIEDICIALHEMHETYHIAHNNLSHENIVLQQTNRWHAFITQYDFACGEGIRPKYIFPYFANNLYTPPEELLEISQFFHKKNRESRTALYDRAKARDLYCLGNIMWLILQRKIISWQKSTSEYMQELVYLHTQKKKKSIDTASIEERLHTTLALHQKQYAERVQLIDEKYTHAEGAEKKEYTLLRLALQLLNPDYVKRNALSTILQTIPQIILL